MPASGYGDGPDAAGRAGAHDRCMTNTASFRRLTVLFVTALAAGVLALVVTFASPGASPSAPAGTVPSAPMSSIEFASQSAN